MRARIGRREFLASTAALASTGLFAAQKPNRKARIAITLDLEMSREYPQRGMTEWDYEKGNLDEPTKQYAERAAEIVRERGGQIHFFCVGRVLEQPDIRWLERLAGAGHPIGNHTYDHVNVKATQAAETQFRFRRAPWLVEGRSAAQIIRDNIRLTNLALAERAGIRPAGFRTPGGFANGLADRPEVQQMLLELGFNWASSKYPSHMTGPSGEEPSQAVFDAIVAAQAEAQPFAYPSGLVEVPMSPISDVSAFRSLRWKLAWFLRAIELAVQWAIRTGSVFDYLAHPSCLVVEDPQFESIKLICDMVRRHSERAEIVSLATIAEQHRAD